MGEIIESIQSLVEGLFDSIIYRNTPEKLFNTYPPSTYKTTEDMVDWERHKASKWLKFISKTDKKNITKIIEKSANISQQNDNYNISLIAIGSSTFGKKNYKNIDMLLEANNGQFYQELFASIKLECDIVMPYLNSHFGIKDRDWTIHNIHPKNYEKKISLGIFDKFNEQSPKTGQKLIAYLKKVRKPYVTLILDNKKMIE